MAIEPGVFALPLEPNTGEYVPVGKYPFALGLATPGDLHEVGGLVRDPNADQAQWGLSRLWQVPAAPMRIARATMDCPDTVFSLIEDARNWLWTKGTDQWATPWPDKATRDARVFRGIRTGKTWIVWHGESPAATVTIASRPNAAIWSGLAGGCDLSEPAVYAHRLITARRYRGQGLGAELIDWVGLQGRRQYGAKWIRIDVWTSNTALHDYYMKTGFERCGYCADPAYPSGALFQKSISTIRQAASPLFTDSRQRGNVHLSGNAHTVGSDH